jgi:tRNA pseudouridine55 synthase
MSPLDGLLLIDKQPGMTSHDVVARARRILGMRAVGHAGTLDPLASGLLILLIGEGTKVSDYILNGDKAYVVRAKLGLRTDSYDTDGKVLSEQKVDFSSEKSKLEVAVKSLEGDLKLPVPIHSAVKVEGKKLYEHARAGEQIETPIREMGFYDLEILDSGPDWVDVKMLCSKGTFVRAWVNALGEKLGCGATVSSLRRIFSAPFKVEQAINLEELELRWNKREEELGTAERRGEFLSPAWVPLRESLPDFKLAWVEGQDERLLRNGQISKGLQAQLLRFVSVDTNETPGVRVLSRETQQMVAILLASPGEFYKIKRVFV